jgi:hypothetical protein
MTSRSNLFVCRWLLLAALAPVPTALACEKKDTRQVRVSVVIILASEKDDKVNKKLECIAREVRKMHPTLKGFRFDDLTAQSLQIGSKGVFKLIENQNASIVVQQVADKMDRICLKVAPPQMGEITYSTPCGKFLPVVTPFRNKAGELLILAIQVEPCKKK